MKTVAENSKAIAYAENLRPSLEAIIQKGFE